MEAIRAANNDPWSLITSVDMSSGIVRFDTATPNITSVSPTVIPYTTGTEITILGSNLKDSAVVSFGDMYNAYVTYKDDHMVVTRITTPFRLTEEITRPVQIHTVYGKVSNSLPISLSKTAITSTTPVTKDTFDGHGCNLTKGQSYCTATNGCVNSVADCRALGEIPPPKIQPKTIVPVTPTPHDYDTHNCDLTAGQSWCEPLQKCIPSGYDCTTGTPPPEVIKDQVLDVHGCDVTGGEHWCDTVQRCFTYGAECPTTPPASTKHELDAHNCDLTLEQFWCESDQKCAVKGYICPTVGLTLTGTTPTPDPHGCSTEQDWCAATGNCIPKGSACSYSVMDLDEHGCCTGCGDSWCEYSQTCVLAGGQCQPVGGSPEIITNAPTGETPVAGEAGGIGGIPPIFVGAAALIAVLLISK